VEMITHLACYARRAFGDHLDSVAFVVGQPENPQGLAPCWLTDSR